MQREGSWRDDPNLNGRFHPEHPDDLQVIVHEGGPRLSDAAPELMWVKVVERHSNDVYAGLVLNAPHGLHSVALGSRILFLTLPNVEHPFRVTEKYLAERPTWNITPCDQCGFSELFDAPSDLIRVVFPSLAPGQIPDAFTSFCPLCGGIQVVERSGASVSNEPPYRNWWQFWR